MTFRPPARVAVICSRWTRSTVQSAGRGCLWTDLGIVWKDRQSEGGDNTQELHDHRRAATLPALFAGATSERPARPGRWPVVLPGRGVSRLAPGSCDDRATQAAEGTSVRNVAVRGSGVTERFIVREQKGFTESGAVSRSLYIADSLNAYREVASFRPTRGVHYVTARGRAVDACAALNRTHQPQEPSSLNA